MNFDGFGPAKVSGSLTGSGSIVISGAALTLGSNDTFSGGISVGGINGELILASGGVENSNEVINSGGILELLGGAQSAGAPILNSGSILEVGSGYTLSGFVDSGGETLTVLSSGVALDDSTEKNSASFLFMNVSSGGIASNTNVGSGTELFVYSGGTTVSSTVLGTEWLSAATASALDTTVSGTDTNIIGGLIVNSGAVASNTTLVNGTLSVASGGVVEGTTTIHGGPAGGIVGLATGAIVSGPIDFDVAAFGGFGGTLQISATVPNLVVGGFSVNTTLQWMGQAVDSGGTTTITANSSGSLLEVKENGQTLDVQFGEDLSGDQFAIGSIGLRLV